MSIRQLLQVDLCLQEGERASLRCDPLMEYLIVRVSDKNDHTLSNRLLKINKNYYYG